MIQFAIELNFMIMINAKARYLRPHVLKLLIQSEAQSELENACACARMMMRSNCVRAPI